VTPGTAAHYARELYYGTLQPHHLRYTFPTTGRRKGRSQHLAFSGVSLPGSQHCFTAHHAGPQPTSAYAARAANCARTRAQPSSEQPLN